MLKGLGDIGNILKMQRELKSIQKKISKSKMDGTNKKETVKATVSGEYKLLELSIDESLIQGNQKDLENAICDAVNNAVSNMKDFSSEEMKKLTGGMNIPGMGDMLK